VVDDGSGIPPEDWDRVTQRFGARMADGEGAGGLGFAIASEVMKAHGGSLMFHVADESGFTVALVFPRREAAA
jgi:two-component system sensor histidine kinase TctE